jgi:hypothetical protein
MPNNNDRRKLYQDFDYINSRININRFEKIILLILEINNLYMNIIFLF